MPSHSQLYTSFLLLFVQKKIRFCDQDPSALFVGKLPIGTLDRIPTDLIIEILKASPVKTLARFLCLSKQYATIIRSREFMKSYLIKSWTRPQSLIFTFDEVKSDSFKRFFFSASQSQNQGESSSSVATYLMNCPSIPYKSFAPSVHGLIFYGPPSKLMVYNPSTRQYITLPKFDSPRTNVFYPFCVADGGEFVLAPVIIRGKEPFYVLYYNIKTNVVRRVYIEGIFTEPKDPLRDEDPCQTTFSIFAGQIDNLMFL